MLCFNPNNRITIEEALAHPYMKMFHSPSDESICKSKAKTPLNDNIKLSKNEYKKALSKLINSKQQSKRSSTSKDMERNSKNKSSTNQLESVSHTNSVMSSEIRQEGRAARKSSNQPTQKSVSQAFDELERKKSHHAIHNDNRDPRRSTSKSRLEDYAGHPTNDKHWPITKNTKAAHRNSSKDKAKRATEKSMEKKASINYFHDDDSFHKSIPKSSAHHEKSNSRQFEGSYLRERSQNRQDTTTTYADSKARKSSASKYANPFESKPANTTPYYYAHKRDSFDVSGDNDHASKQVKKKVPDYPYFGTTNENVYNHRAYYNPGQHTRNKSNSRSQTIK